MNKIKYCLMILVVMVMFKNVFAQTGDLRIHRVTGTITRFALTDIISLDFSDENTVRIIHTYPYSASPYYLATTEFDSITFCKIEGSVTDIEGKIYRTVKINNDWWMAENLNTIHYKTGNIAASEIPEVTVADTWENYPNGAYCNYDNVASNASTFGRLYNWNAVNTGNLAPEGWHVSTRAEWDALDSYIGVSDGLKLKSDDTPTEDNWTDVNVSNDGGGDDTYGFTALPGGRRSGNNGLFSSLHDYAFFWTSDNANSSSTWYYQMSYSNNNLTNSTYVKDSGYSVRCVRD